MNLDQLVDAALRGGSANTGSLNRRQAELAIRGNANRAKLRPQLEQIRDVMDEVFACDTAFGDCDRGSMSSGHCFFSSMVVQDLFGGVIRFDRVKKIPHYWTQVGKTSVDLTGDQLGRARVQVTQRNLYGGGQPFQRRRGTLLTGEDNREAMRKYKRFRGRLATALRDQGLGSYATRLT